MAWNDPPSFNYQQLTGSDRKFKHRYVSNTKLGQPQSQFMHQPQTSVQSQVNQQHLSQQPYQSYDQFRQDAHLGANYNNNNNNTVTNTSTLGSSYSNNQVDQNQMFSMAPQPANAEAASAAAAAPAPAVTFQFQPAPPSQQQYLQQ